MHADAAACFKEYEYLKARGTQPAGEAGARHLVRAAPEATSGQWEEAKTPSRAGLARHAQAEATGLPKRHLVQLVDSAADLPPAFAVLLANAAVLLANAPDLVANAPDLVANAADLVANAPDLLANAAVLLANAADLLANATDPPAPATDMAAGAASRIRGSSRPRSASRRLSSGPLGRSSAPHDCPPAARCPASATRRPP